MRGYSEAANVTLFDDGKAHAPFCAPVADDVTAADGCHAVEESVPASARDDFGLVGALGHGASCGTAKVRHGRRASVYVDGRRWTRRGQFTYD